jgi:hypothetical protein
MDFLSGLFAGGMPPIPNEKRKEVSQLIDELIGIGARDDFLAEHPGGLFNGQCHNIRARAIGKRLDEIGGLPLMEYANKRVRRKLGANMSAHLDYAWTDIGEWYG